MEKQLKAFGIDYIRTDEGITPLDGSNEKHVELLFQIIDSGMQFKIPVILTPELATLFLEGEGENSRNSENPRNLNIRRVKEVLVPDIDNGKFVPLNAMVGFKGCNCGSNSTGKLCDGQHISTATQIASGGNSILVWVETGLTKERIMVLDNHSPRAAHNAIEGMDKTSQGILNKILEINAGRSKRSTNALDKYWDRFGAEIQQVLSMRSEYKEKPKNSAFHAALVGAMRNGVTPDDIKRFIVEIFGEDTSWIQAANFKNIMHSNHYEGYTEKYTSRQYKLTLITLGMYLDGSKESIPRVNIVDKYNPSERWAVKL